MAVQIDLVVDQNHRK